MESSEGEPVSLASWYPRGPVLIVFYRGGWCPLCNAQIHALTEAWPELQRRSVTPLLISVDRTEEAAKTEATYAIPFPVLADPDLAAHRAFQVVHHADDAEVRRLKDHGLDIEVASGKDHHELAIPSMFLVDRHGVIRWAHADEDYRTRPSVAQVLDAIDRVGLR